jgi:hypothetical protein
MMSISHEKFHPYILDIILDSLTAIIILFATVLLVTVFKRFFEKVGYKMIFDITSLAATMVRWC